MLETLLEDMLLKSAVNVVIFPKSLIGATMQDGG